MPDSLTNAVYQRANNNGYSNSGDDTEGAGSYTLGTPKGTAAPAAYTTSEQPDPLGEPAIVKFFDAMFSIADEHRRPREIIWDGCWALYNNQFDFSTKAWWQHKVPIPKVRTTVDRAVGIVRKTLLRMYPFYGIQSESKMGRTKGRFSMLLTDYWFDQINIIETIVNAVKISLVTSVCPVKVWMSRIRDVELKLSQDQVDTPTYEFGIQTGSTSQTQRKSTLEETWRGLLGVEVVNPKDFWIIPETKGRGMIERTTMPLNEIISLSKPGKDGTPAIYDKDAVKELINGVNLPIDKTDDIAKQTGEGTFSANDYMRVIPLWHYWGDIYDNQGNLLLCDARFTLADNKRILLRKPSRNPFFHKEPPYVVGSPYTVPFSTYNRGMVEDIGEIARSICEMANLIADGALYDALKAFSIDVDQLDDPMDIKNGMYPGKTFIRSSSKATAPNEALVQTIDVGRVPTEAMNMVGLFEKYYEEGSYVNEWVAGQGGKRGGTLGEAQLKTQSALEGLDEIARNLETTLIEPLVTKANKVIYQYHDNYMLQRLVDNYPQLAMLIQGMSPEERYVTMVKDFSFKVRGLSVMIDRQQRIGELKEILTLLSYLPGFLEQLDPQATLEEILMPIGWDPRRLLINGGAGGGTVGTPTVGARPVPQPVPPPGTMTGNIPKQGGNVQNGQLTPMQTRNAQEGAAKGGATNNPQGQPNRALQYFLQNAMARNQTSGFFGR